MSKHLSTSTNSVDEMHQAAAVLHCPMTYEKLWEHHGTAGARRQPALPSAEAPARKVLLQGKPLPWAALNNASPAELSLCREGHAHTLGFPRKGNQPRCKGRGQSACLP